MSSKRLNIKEFAAKLGVSTATVSRAFSTKGRISDKTRKYILEKAKELGYSANANARNLILRKSDSIGFFYPSLIKGEPDFFISEIMLGINETAVQNDMRLHVYPFPVDKSIDDTGYSRLIMDGALAGVIILGGTAPAEQFREVALESGITNILIGDMSKSEDAAIGFNTGQGAIEAGKHFSKTARKSPAFVCGLQDDRKLKGFKKGLGKLASKLIVDTGGSTFQAGCEAYERLKKSDVDCVLFANDIIAIGFMKAAIADGVDIPEDIAVIGCDDIKFATYHTPSLSTIAIPTYELGKRAFQSLSDMIEGGKSKTIGEIMECKLVLRESS